jgi:hypothetical protein
MSSFRIEFVERAKKTGYLTVALGLVTALQGVTIFFALRELLGGGAEGAIVPVLGALVIGVAFWIAWHWLSGVGPLSHQPVSRTMFITIAAALTLVGIATSSWFLTSTISGGTATRAHMRAYLAAANAQLADLSANAEAESELGAKITRIAASWRVMLKDEIGGKMGNPGGDGPKAATYRRAADDMDALHGEVSAAFDKSKLARKKSRDLIQEMTVLANGRHGASEEGQIKFAAMAARLDGGFAEIDQITALPLVGRTGIVSVKSLGAEIVSKDEQFTKSLVEAARRIKEERRPLKGVVYEPTTRAQAVIDYFSVAVPGWIVAVAFDTLPFLMFLMMMIGFAEARDEYRPRRPFEVLPGGKNEVAA